MTQIWETSVLKQNQVPDSGSDDDDEDYVLLLWDTPTHKPFPGPCCQADLPQCRCVLMLITAELRMPRPGTDGCCTVSQTSCVGGLQLSTIAANELGTVGLTNTFCVTGLTCGVSRGEVPGRLVIFTFFSRVSSLIWDRQKDVADLAVRPGTLLAQSLVWGLQTSPPAPRRMLSIELEYLACPTLHDRSDYTL